MKKRDSEFILFCDLDGTILDAEGKIQPNVLQYMKKMSNICYVATGRSQNSLLCVPDYERLVSIFEAQMICYNGNALWNTSNRCLQVLNSIQNVGIKVEKLVEEKIEFAIDLGGVIYSTSKGSALRYSLYNMVPRKFIRIGVNEIKSEAQGLLLHIYCDSRERVFVEKLFSNTEIRYEYWPKYLIVYPAHTDKVNAIRYIKKLYYYSEQKIATLGNSDNDIGMTQFADYGIAVSESTNGLKKIADAILDGTCVNTTSKKRFNDGSNK